MRACVCVHVRSCVCVHALVFVCASVFMCACVGVFVCACVPSFTLHVLTIAMGYFITFDNISQLVMLELYCT
jgi:hypothetical protein